jgi:hypothetical protein
MAITIPAKLVIAAKNDLLTPPIDIDPIGAALENLNFLYAHHAPALVSVMPILVSGLNRDTSFTFGVMPSQDGLRYAFEHRLYPAATGNTSVRVEQWTGAAWSDVYAATAHATVAATWKVISHTGTISRLADRLRVTYSASTGAYVPSHILAYPSPDTSLAPFAATWAVTSGFKSYADGLLDAGTTGQPLTTEHLDRCASGSIIVLRDRYHNLMSCVQEDGGLGVPRVVAPSACSGNTGWVTVGRARGQWPGQKGAVLQVRAMATHSAGSLASAIRVGLVGGPSVLLTADGTLQSNTLTVTGTGELGQMLEWMVEVKSVAGQTTKLNSAMVFWRPGD